MSAETNSSTAEGTLNQYTKDFRKKAIALGHDVEELGSITKEIANGAVDVLQENAMKYYGQGVKKAEKLEKRVERTIGENPLASVLIAAGIGILAGAFINRK